MWILGVVIVVVLAACVAALFLGGGRGPFAAVSDIAKSGKLYGTRHARTDFHDDLRKPRNEEELL